MEAIKDIDRVGLRSDDHSKQYLKDRGVIFEKFDHMGEKLSELKAGIEQSDIENSEKENRLYNKLHDKLRKNREEITAKLATLTTTLNDLSITTRAAGTRRKLINGIIQHTPTFISMLVAIVALAVSFKAMKGL